MHHQTNIVQYIQQILLICLLTATATALVQAKVLGTRQSQVIQSSQLGQQVQFVQTPDGLSAPEWANIQQQVSAGKYRAYPDSKGGYNSSNPAHGWQIRYAPDGTTTLTSRDRKATAYHLGMTLNAIGYHTMHHLRHPQLISADDSTVTYQWNNNLKEWWINSPTGLEQWFSLEQRPVGAKRGQSLILQMTLDSELQSRLLDNSIHFGRADETKITYNKLKVWDATGRILPARMQLTKNVLNLIIEESDASYPLTIDPSFQQQSYLKASNAGSSDSFGFSVAIDGDTLVVGAFGEASNTTTVNGDQSDNSASNAGGAYIFTRTAEGWTQQAYLKASNTQGGDRFGGSVAIGGNTVVIGALGEASNATSVNGNQNDNSVSNSGAAYVFSRTAGVWTQQAYLKASNAEGGDLFGKSVAITGDTAVVGAVGEDSSATIVNGNQTNNTSDFSGAAYVFTRTTGVWTQQAYLKASNTDSDDQFGVSLAIAGDTVIVGASNEDSNAISINGDPDDNAASNAGAAYVFTRTTGVWTQQAYLKASNTDVDDQFGVSVAIADETVIVGAEGEDSIGNQSDNSADFAGAAYVFTRSAGSWTQQAYLKASNAESDDLEEGDLFGHFVAISGDTAVIGAIGEDSNATTVNGDQTDNSARFAGAAYVFTRTANVWTQQDYLKASNTDVNDLENGDLFGISVAISGKTVVIGARNEDSNAITVNGNQADNSASNAGAAYVFNLTPNIVGPTACTLDVDGNASADALTDGLLFIRYMFGSRDQSLILDVVASDCASCSADQLESILEQCGTAGTSDIDGNGEIDALTDGLLIIRYLFGNRGDALIQDSVASDCSRCSVSEIETYIQGLLP
jgi:hypothetical protein